MKFTIHTLTIDDDGFAYAMLLNSTGHNGGALTDHPSFADEAFYYEGLSSLVVGAEIDLSRGVDQ